MEWVAHFDPATQLVDVTVTGTLKPGPLREMTRELRDLVEKHQSKGVLLDYTAADFALKPYEIFERPKVLEQLGFPADVKVAVQFHTLNEDTQFLENVYRNKGFPVRVFADKSTAMNWLETPMSK